MDPDVDDEEPSALDFARHCGLCTPYDSESPTIGNLPPPYSDDIDQDLRDLLNAPITNTVNKLTRERLAVNKEAAMLLKAVHDLREAPPNDPFLRDRRNWMLSLKQELPVLRTDNELDLLNFGTTFMPDFKELKIPSEIVNQENDEGLEWPAKYLSYPAQCEAQIKTEKLTVSRDVLVHLQDAIRDLYSSNDFEKLKLESLNYKPNIARRSVTPPLLPLSPPLTPYIPSSPANRLPFASDSSGSVAAEAKSLEQQIMVTDSLTRKNSDSDDSMLLDITHPPHLSPLLEERTSTILKRRAENLKVEGPLTPPMFSTSPLKKLKSVSFSDILHEFIPEVPWAQVADDNGEEDSDYGFDTVLRDIEPLAKEAVKRVENEQLSGADTTARVSVPDADFSFPVAPWNEYSQRNGGKYRPGHTEMGAQIDFLRRVKREDLKTATYWHGLSIPERDLQWSIFITRISKINVDEKLHGETDLSKMLTDTITGTIATSSSQVWKPEGLRLLDEHDDEEDIELAEIEERRDVEALIRKRKLEMEEEAAEVHRKCNFPQSMSQLQPLIRPQRDILEGHHWNGGMPISHAPAKIRCKTTSYKEQRPQASLARHKTTQVLKDTSNDLMFGGFSATSALHKFMETRGKDAKVVSTKCAEASQPTKNIRAQSANALAVRSREPSSDRIIPAKQQGAAKVVTNDSGTSMASPSLPLLEPVLKNLAPCSFIVTSAFLQQRTLTKQIEKLYPKAEIVYRDYDLPHPPAKEADVLLSPSTGLILTTLQQVKQRPLPGQPDRSPIKERMTTLQLRYERLVVVISEGTSREVENHGSRPDDPRDFEALTRFENFADRLEGNVVVKYVRGGEEAMARSIVIEMAKYGLPHGSRDIGDIKPLATETTWEIFLRRAGLNPFAAQVIVAQLKKPYDLRLPIASSSPTSSGRPSVISVFGLPAFMMMIEEERVRYFQALMGGSRILKRVSRVLDQEWVSAAHGFRM